MINLCFWKKKEEDPYKTWGTCFHKVTRESFYAAGTITKPYEAYDKIRYSGNKVILDKTTKWECFANGNVIWIDVKDLRFPMMNDNPV